MEMAEQEASVEDSIRAAFSEVTRSEGTSWGDAEVADNLNLTDEEAEAIRASDRDSNWQELVDDLSWEFSSATFCFLDEVGFRYYLAPSMIRCLRAGEDNGILFHVYLPAHEIRTVLAWNGQELAPIQIDNEFEPERLMRLGFFESLNNEQRRAVRQFVEYMSKIDPSNMGWQEALQGYWKDF